MVHRQVGVTDFREFGGQALRLRKRFGEVALVHTFGFGRQGFLGRTGESRRVRVERELASQEDEFRGDVSIERQVEQGQKRVPYTLGRFLETREGGEGQMEPFGHELEESGMEARGKSGLGGREVDDLHQQQSVLEGGVDSLELDGQVWKDHFAEGGQKHPEGVQRGRVGGARKRRTC